MTTKFENAEACLQQVHMMLKIDPDTRDIPMEDVRAGWAASEKAHIGWPQNQDVWKFEVGGYEFAISKFRDGRALWLFYPNGMARRV